MAESPDELGVARELSVQHAQAAMCRAVLADSPVDALLLELCELLSRALPSPAVAFFEEVDGTLALIAGVGPWEPGERSMLASVAPSAAPVAVALRELPSLASEIAGRAPWHGDGLVAGLTRPGGRRVALVVAFKVDGESAGPIAAAELVGLAAELAGAGWARRYLEEELRSSERRLVEAQELAHMGSYDWNIVTDQNIWSDELFRIYGFEPQSFNASYERFLSLLHEDDREKIMAVHQRAYQSLEPYEMEERIVHPDGSVRILASTGEVIADEAGRPVRMRGVCIDVTDRRRVEDELLRLDQVEDHRRQALEINDNVVQGLTSILWTLGREAESTAQEVTRRTLESARSMMSRLLDLGGDVVAGDLTRTAPPDRTIAGTLPGVIALDALDAPDLPEPLPAAAAPPVRLLIADDSDDIRLLLRFQLEAHSGFHIVGEAVTGPEAVAQAATLQPEVVLLDMAMPGGDGLSAIPGIKEASPDTKIIALSGFSASRLAAPALEAGAAAYVEKGSFQDLLAALTEVLPQMDLASRSSAPALSIVDSGSPSDEDSEVVVAIGHLVHELRTPTAVVSGIVEMLVRGRDALSSAAADELYDALLRNTSVLTDLVARASEGVGAASSALHEEPVDVHDLVEVTASDVSALPDMPAIEVVGPASAAVGNLDQLRVHQVLTNLLSNAARFAGADGTVRAIVRVETDVIEVVIEDDGPGVDPELGERVFRPFIKDTNRAGGLGLGLYVSRTIARSHGGDLRFENLTPHGARFVLTLPRSAAATTSR